MLSFIYVIESGLLEWKWICVDFIVCFNMYVFIVRTFVTLNVLYFLHILQCYWILHCLAYSRFHIYIMKRKPKQWSSIPPISTKRTTPSNFNCTHWTQQRPRHTTLKMQVLAWDTMFCRVYCKVETPYLHTVVNKWKMIPIQFFQL
jgi:hypothetical protein